MTVSTDLACCIALSNFKVVMIVDVRICKDTLFFLGQEVLKRFYIPISISDSFSFQILMLLYILED
jgi:hypothetical protein